MTTLKASEEGLVKIKQARREMGSTIEDPRWLVEASQNLEPIELGLLPGPMPMACRCQLGGVFYEEENPLKPMLSGLSARFCS